MSGFFPKLGQWPIAGVLVCALALLAYWDENTRRLGIEAVWPSLLAFLLAAVFFTCLLRWACGTWARAGIAAGIVFLYIFYIPEVPGIAEIPAAWAALVHIGVIAALTGIYFLLPRAPARFADFAGRANAVLMLIFAVSAIPLAGKQLAMENNRSAATRVFTEFEGQADSSSPDVWHIVLDRYPSTESLRSVYQFDNTPFVTALRERGFEVADRAYSNYQRTGHSIASTMNGSMLDDMAVPMADAGDDWVPIYRSMANNAATRFFNGVGYETIFLGSWWEPTRTNPQASRSVSIRSWPQLSRLVISRSAVGFWIDLFGIDLFDDRTDQCLRANEKFNLLRQIAGEAGQKHVFAHFLVPHPPFVLNSDGSCRSLGLARQSTRRDNFINQVEFVNSEILSLVEAILEGPNAAYIVVHSDEGPWPEPYVGDEHGMGTDPVKVPWTDLTDAQLQEKFGILLAVRAPSGNAPASMPMSPVQIYPAMLRDEFGSPAPVPASRHVVFVAGDALYEWHDVTADLVSEDQQDPN